VRGALSRQGWRLLAEELRSRPRALARLAGWSMVEMLPVAASGLVIARAIDDGFLQRAPAVGFSWLAVLAAAMVVGALGARRTFGALADLAEPLRDAMIRTVVTGAIGRAVAGVDRADATAVARLTGQTEGVRQMSAALLMTVRQFAFTLVATVAGLVALIPVITLLVVPPVLLALALFWWLLLGVAPRAKTALLASEHTSEAVGKVTAGVRDIVACGAEGSAAATAGAVIEAQAAAERRLARISANRIVIIALGGQLPLVIVLVTAPWLIDSSMASPGQVVGAVIYLATSLQPAFSTLVLGVGSLGVQLGVVLHRISEASQVPVPASPSRPRSPQGHQLEVRDLTFAYGPDAVPVVRGLELTLAPGEHLAIAGPSGIGKSTLANLLTGLLTPGSGAVCLGGVPLPEVDPALLRARMALIPQEAYVFAGTLWENLCYLRPDASDAALQRTCSALPLDPLVHRLGGYDGPVSAGMLSAGERQLVALGRVHLSGAAVVILDEATCYLDPGTEAEVESAFAARHGSLVVIAHRISSALRADRVLLLDGSTVQSGTHGELLAASPLYTDLVGQWDAEPGDTEPTGAPWSRASERSSSAHCSSSRAD